VTSKVRVVPDRIEGKTQLANKIAAETRLAATKAAGLPKNYIGPIVPAKKPKDWEQPGLSWLEKGIFYATAGENIKKAPGVILKALTDTASSFYKFGNATTVYPKFISFNSGLETFGTYSLMTGKGNITPKSQDPRARRRVRAIDGIFDRRIYN
jgi:hypothetical protein